MSQLQGRGQDLGQEPALPLARLARLARLVPLVRLVRLVPLARVARPPVNRRMRSVSG
jgi:hypothetical protein